MNGIHDLGGMHGLGPIDPPANEPVFHHDWEKRAFSLFAATFVFTGYTIDEFRHDIEQMGAVEYLEHSYYEHWMHAFEATLIRHGHITRDELDARIAKLAQEAH
jgi:nitrile hydratase